MNIKPFTVANLPFAGTVPRGTYTYVDDALAPAFLAEVVGGGTILALVFSDNNMWKVGQNLE